MTLLPGWAFPLVCFHACCGLAATLALLRDAVLFNQNCFEAVILRQRWASDLADENEQRKCHHREGLISWTCTTSFALHVENSRAPKNYCGTPCLDLDSSGQNSMKGDPDQKLAKQISWRQHPHICFIGIPLHSRRASGRCGEIPLFGTKLSFVAKAVRCSLLPFKRSLLAGSHCSRSMCIQWWAVIECRNFQLSTRRFAPPAVMAQSIRSLCELECKVFLASLVP